MNRLIRLDLPIRLSVNEVRIAGREPSGRLVTPVPAKPSLLAAELVGLLELIAQLGSAKVFAQLSKSLFEGEQCALHRFGIGMRNVAPHRVRTRAQARHLAQRASAHVLQ